VWTCVARWLLGLFVSVIVGHVFVRRAWSSLHTRLDQEHGETGDDRSPWVPRALGFAERFALCLLVGCQVPNLVTASVAWIALKLAAGWQRGTPEKGELRAVRSRALVGILLSLISLAFGALGGLICRGGGFCRR
jgi:hypothetical protein